MSTQHTPGPWYADFDGATGKATRVRASAKGGRDQLCIADCAQGAGDFDLLEANARLIAAVPDLEEALQGAMEALAMCQPRTDHGAACQHVAMLAGRAALAKARGGA